MPARHCYCRTTSCVWLGSVAHSSHSLWRVQEDAELCRLRQQHTRATKSETQGLRPHPPPLSHLFFAFLLCFMSSFRLGCLLPPLCCCCAAAAAGCWGAVLATFPLVGLGAAALQAYREDMQATQTHHADKQADKGCTRRSRAG